MALRILMEPWTRIAAPDRSGPSPVGHGLDPRIRRGQLRASRRALPQD
jgi:hypothetical protein